ncbi:MAG: tetratricopeptide repeat protein, partial [Anaerolineae bacterium]
ERSENEAKKREYLRKAGEAAQADYANEAAMSYYERLLPLLPVEEQVDIMRKLGDVLQLVGKWSEAGDLYQRALELAEELGDRSAQAWCQTAMGKQLGWKQGQFAEASAWLERARAGFGELGDQAGVAEVLHIGGVLAAMQGNWETASALWEETLAIRQGMGDKPNMARVISNLGIVARNRGDYGVAHSLHEEALAIRREVGDKLWIADSLNNLANVLLDQGIYADARSCLEKAVAIRREVGDRWAIANSLNNLGNVVRAQGDYTEAHSLYKQSLTINRELGDPRAIAYLLEDIGGLAAMQGQAERALRLFGAAAALRETSGVLLSSTERDKLEQMLGPARQALGEAAASVVAEGQAMPLEQAIEYALKSDETG